MILERIRQLYPELTESQKRLADFCSTSYREAAFMTASVMACHLSVNEGTVIRFAQRLGYSGYPDFIRDVQAIIRTGLRARYEPESMAEPQDPFLTVLGKEIESMGWAASQISPELASQVLDVLRQARRVVVIGQGISAPLANLLSMSLRSLGMLAESPPADALGLAMALAEVDEQWAVIAISATSESRETANALTYARKMGAGTVALACSPTDPCAQAAELALICPPDDRLVLPPLGVMATLLDAIVQTLGADDVEGVRDRAQRFEAARQWVLPGNSR
jgi:DNA-binding MurR/RpiR family transcriptional regulator